MNTSGIALMMALVLCGSFANAAVSTIAGENPQPVNFENVKVYTCPGTGCNNCTLVPLNPNATFNGNCESLNGKSASEWYIASSNTLQTLSYGNSDCSGSPIRTSDLPVNSCMNYVSASSSSSMIIYYTSAPNPVPTPAPTNTPQPAYYKYIAAYSCTDSGCNNCTRVYPNPNTVINGNCATLNGHSTAEWYFPNNNSLQSVAYQTTDCSGSPFSDSIIQLNKCMEFGGTSTIVEYTNGPAPIVPPVPKPALVKDIKPFMCSGTKCSNCTLEKLGPNVTVRANCAMWKNKGTSASYFLENNDKTLLIKFFGNNVMCTGTPSDSYSFPLDKCVSDGHKTEIIYYTGGDDSTKSFDDVPFETKEQFSFALRK